MDQTSSQPMENVAWYPSTGVPAWFWSTLIVIILFFPLALLDFRLIHWFALPTILCGILVGMDGVRWLRGEYDTLDPRGLLGLVGIHLFFLAPLLTVFWEAQLVRPYVAIRIEDVRPWIGVMSILNFLGMLGFYWAESAAYRRSVLRSRGCWTVRQGWAPMLLFVLIILCFVAQAYLFYKRGGFVTRLAYDERAVRGGEGIPRLFATSFPVFFMMLITLRRTYMPSVRTGRVVVLSLIVMLTAYVFMTMGLAGSRSSTIWPLVWIVGIVHFFWRRLSRKDIFIGLAFFFVFSWLYTFYKWGGADIVQRALQHGISSVAEESRFGWRRVLVGDLSRASVQAQMAYVVLDKPYGYNFRWGTTIWGDMLAIVPRWIHVNDYNLYGKSGKEIAGTDLMRGPGIFNPANPYSASRFQYGLAGQAILNFGVWAIPPAFLLWGALFGWFRGWLASLPETDLRLFIAPAMINFVLLMLIIDFNNLLYFAIFRIAAPAIVVMLIAHKVRGGDADRFPVLGHD